MIGSFLLSFLFKDRLRFLVLDRGGEVEKKRIKEKKGKFLAINVSFF